MKRQRERRSKGVVRLLLILLCVAAIAACRRDPRLDALIQMEQPSAVAPSPERIQELKDTIAEYEDVVSQKVQAALKQASYLKLLAQEYVRSELYGPALDTLAEALILEPRNQVLHQLAGVSAGFLGKAQPRASDRAYYFAMAESYYLQSLEIDPYFQDGLYALGTLYHFELGRHLDAIEALETLLDRAPTHIQGLFVLARAHAAVGNIEEAAAAYNSIVENSADTDVAERARRNRQLLLGEVE